MHAVRHGRERARRAPGLLAAIALALAPTPPAGAAYQHPGLTELISIGVDGQPVDTSITPAQASVSADGRYVAFRHAWWILLRDRALSRTETATVPYAGGAPDGASSFPRITPDGRNVAFTSEASNLAPGDTNDLPDAFIRDRLLGVTERISVGPGGEQANGGSAADGISVDGRYVAFSSVATNLVPGGTNGEAQVYVRDRLTGTNELVSVGPGGVQADRDAAASAISPDGRYVAFYSTATNLVPGGVDGMPYVYLHDRQTRVTERVSVGPDGRAFDCQTVRTPVVGVGPYPLISSQISVSEGGRYVAFQFCGGHQVSGEAPGLLSGTQVYVRDRLAGATELAGLSSDGTQATYCNTPTISADGRYVSLYCDGLPNPPPYDRPGGWSYVRDRLLGTTELASVPAEPIEGLPSGLSAIYPAMSPTGRYVAFKSGDGFTAQETGLGNIYLRDRGPSLGVLPGLSALVSSSGVEVRGRAAFSGEVITAASHTALPGLGEIGAGITLAQVMVRPEQEDLAVRIRTTKLPPHSGGTPGLVYGLSFTSGGIRYEVRGSRRSVADAASGSPTFALSPGSFALFRCDPVCLQQATLRGSFAFTGPEALVAVPSSLLPGVAQMSGVRAWIAPGELAASSLVPVDEVALPDAAVPSPRVEVGIAPAGAREDQVSEWQAVLPVQGGFEAALPLPPSGGWRVWARACLGSCAEASSVDVHV